MANRKELQNKTNSNKGISRVIRENKRTEAEIRNEQTPLERTKANRLRHSKLVSALANSAAGSVESLGDFTQYAEESE